MAVKATFYAALIFTFVLIAHFILNSLIADFMHLKVGPETLIGVAPQALLTGQNPNDVGQHQAREEEASACTSIILLCQFRKLCLLY